MSLKNLKKIFVVCFLSGACASLNARISLTLLEAFNKDLNSSHYFNLIWGAVAIESGFIYNLRFFGDYHFNFLEGKRNYKDDAARHDLFDIVKTLFPSNGGLLSTTINAYNKICNELTCKDAIKILVACFKDTSQITINKESFSENEKLKKIKDFNTFLKKIENIVNTANNSIATPLQKEIKEILAQVLLGFIYEKINVKEINQQDPLETCIDTQNTLKNIIGLIPTNSNYSNNNASEKAIAFFKSLWDKNPFPYLTSPISNGIANVVPKNDPINESFKFADCVEVTIRHMLNILFYDPKSGNFNVPTLANKQKEITYFYTIQKNRDMANNGSLHFRTEWNKVMVHIPNVIYKVKDDGTKLNDILYTYEDRSTICGTNEIKAGLINLYNILAYIFGKEQIKRKNCESQEKLLEMLNEQVDMDKGEQIKNESDVVNFLSKKFEALFSNNEDVVSDEFDFPSNLLFDLSEINISIENLDYDRYDVYADLHIKGKKSCQEILEKEYAFDIHIEKGHGNIVLIDPKKTSSFINLSNENLDGLKKSLYCFEPFEKKLFAQNSFYGLYLEKLDTLSAILRFAYNVSNSEILRLDTLKENLDFNIKKLITTENDISISLMTQDITSVEKNFYKFLTEDDFCTKTHPIKEGKEKSYRDYIKNIDLYINDENELTLNFENLKNLTTLHIKNIQGESINLKLKGIKGNLTIYIENLSNLKNVTIENPKDCCFHEIKKCESLEDIKISESEGTKIEECSFAINGNFLYKNWEKTLTY